MNKFIIMSEEKLSTIVYKIYIGNKLSEYNLVKNIAILHSFTDFPIVISVWKMDRHK